MSRFLSGKGRHHGLGFQLEDGIGSWPDNVGAARRDTDIRNGCHKVSDKMQTREMFILSPSNLHENCGFDAKCARVIAHFAGSGAVTEKWIPK